MEKKNGWKRFQRLNLTSKDISTHAKTAEAATVKHAHKFILSRVRNLRESRRAIISWLFLVSAVMVVSMGQFIYSYAKITHPAEIDGGTYAEGMVGELTTLNPLFSEYEAEVSASKLIFSSLYDYDRSGRLRADLASSIKVNESGTTYTVTLRDDALWHDGEPVGADDVVYTVRAMQSPDVRSAHAQVWRGVQIEKVDDRTVKFTLPAYAAFQHALTFAVLPAHILQDANQATLRQNTFNLKPIGSGPFEVRFVQSQPRPQQRIVYLSANDDYYRGAPKLSRFELHAYKTETDLQRAIAANDINAIVDVNVADASLPPRYSVTSQPINSGVYAIFNTESSILKDDGVRKALQLATDTDAVRNTVPGSQPELDYPLIPSQLRNPQLREVPELNLSKAKKLLTKSGWQVKSGEAVRYKKKQPLTLKVVLVKNEQYQAVADELTRQWAELGVKTEVTAFDPEASTQSYTQTVLQPRSYDVLINELVIGADPDVYPYWHSSQAQMLGYNFANYHNRVADDNLSTARSSSNELIRTEKYEKFIREWVKDAPAIALYRSSLHYATSNSVSALPEGTVTPTSVARFSTVRYWTAETSRVYSTP